MLESRVILGKSIEAALFSFKTAKLADASTSLLKALGYASEKTTNLGNDAESFLTSIAAFKPELGSINRDKVFADRWRSCTFLFQLTNDEIPSLAIGQSLLVADANVVRTQIESFVFLAIELEGDQWSRTALAGIARELNRRFPMPAILLFRHGELFSLAVIDRRVSLRDATRDVVESKITVVKDVRFASPHRAHVDILAGLALASLGEQKESKRPSNFRQLYEAWIDALSIQALNKRFYTELACWYYWAVKEVDFPQGGGLDKGKRNSVAVIRLLTRLIFIWFIKEKGLVPEALFEDSQLKKLLEGDPATEPDKSTYYLAILQNLFFATLNVEMGAERKWSQQGAGMKGDRLIHSLYRHKEHFKDADAALELFSRIPFLNGGLFECLDRELTERDFQREPELKKVAAKEGTGWVLRVDGFSRRSDAQPKVPNKIFFGGESNVDLDDELGTSRRQRDVFGLIDLFSRYKFTVDENTPVEEEVALDPELLGKVFENLLASYNEDTKSTARKQSGSFYTPREVVDYMVDEALVAYFVRHFSVPPVGENATAHNGRKGVNALLELDAGSGDLALTVETMASSPAPMEADDGLGNGIEARLRQLLSYTAEGNPFDQAETAKLIAAIEALKMLDPACGSGAFPMGMLTKLVHTLKKLDPDNRQWRAQNLRPLEAQLESAHKIPDPSLREVKIEEAESSIEKTRRDFDNAAHADYTRKLYLIEKCIYGVDIQPIAVQIAKLRFFISLIVSQDVNPGRDNWGITALPNLETKIVAADSLTPIERPANPGLRDLSIDQKEAELTIANEHYFAARTSKTKHKWRDRIFTLRDELAALLEADLFLSKGAARDLVHWNPFDQNQAAKFFDPEWMFQISDGFDITIGNPPYVRQEEIKHLKDNLKQHYDCFSGTADLYVYFYERSIKLLKPGGAFAFITSNKWYRAKYGEKLRDWMNRHTHLRRIIDFGDEAVFTAIAYPTIVIATRRLNEVKQPAESDQLRALNWTQQQPVEMFPSVFASESFTIPQIELNKNGWQIEPPLKRQMLTRLVGAGKPLREYLDSRISRGITTGLNEAFVIDSVTRSRLIDEDARSQEIIKPYLRGRDVKRWRVEFGEQYLIQIESSENALHSWSGKKELDAEKDFARSYPAIYSHFLHFRQAMIDRYDQGKYFWELRACTYWREFDRLKLVSTKVSLQPTFSLDNEARRLGNTAYFIPVAKSDSYLLGLLNSSVSAYYARERFVGKQNDYYEVQPEVLEAFPIPLATSQQKAVLNAIVNSVLATFEPRFEQLINGLVFELFFPSELHGANVRLFDACEKAGVGKLGMLDGEAVVTAANELAARIFANDHVIYAMLFDLQGLDVVRVIEGRE